VAVSDRPVVVVVDDEPDLADLYTAWLGDSYDVRTAYGGEEAIERVDGDVDVALIDRLMPERSGDEVLSTVRDQGYDCQVAMVTAVEPDFDIIEMGFDAYLVKPVLRDDLRETVGRLLTRGTYDAQVRELFSLASKRAALMTQKDPAELAENEAYQELDRRFDELRDELDETVAELDARDFEVTLRRLVANGS
jgi:DNA-binding response OmpR family regulator